ncbi:MAG TPA: hypothetical protein PLD88_15660, partial [Candidatus Berkiella sp.]|nr:hypothetical protein [Candidatus Berkiella sp.]
RGAGNTERLSRNTKNVLHGNDENDNILVQAIKTGDAKIVAMIFSEVEHDKKLALTLLSKSDNKGNLPLLQVLQTLHASNCLCVI